MSFRVAKWLKNVRFATLVRSQMSSIVEVDTSIQEQLERRTQNPVAHLLLAHAWRRTHLRRGAAEPTRL